MSYDFWVEMDSGGPEPMLAEPFFSDIHPDLPSDGIAGTVSVTGRGYARCGNYTSNVSDMWRECLSAAHRELGGASPAIRLSECDRMRCDRRIELLSRAVAWGIEHIDELREMNPGNGWGNAEGAITYLWDIQRMCEAHPNAILRISY